MSGARSAAFVKSLLELCRKGQCIVDEEWETDRDPRASQSMVSVGVHRSASEGG